MLCRRVLAARAVVAQQGMQQQLARVTTHCRTHATHNTLTRTFSHIAAATGSSRHATCTQLQWRPSDSLTRSFSSQKRRPAKSNGEPRLAPGSAKPRPQPPSSPVRPAAVGSRAVAAVPDYPPESDDVMWAGPNLNAADVFVGGGGAAAVTYGLYKYVPAFAQWCDQLPPSVVGLLAVQVGVFALHIVLPPVVVYRNLTCTWNLLARGRVHTLVTNVVSNGHIKHLTSNLAFLMLLGPGVAHVMGDAQFTALFLTAGVLGTVAEVLVLRVQGPAGSAERALARTRPVLGASGAVWAVLAAAFVMLPEVLPWEAIRILAPVMLAGELLRSGISGTKFLPDQGKIARWAHLLGFTVGAVWALAAYGWVKAPSKSQVVKPLPPVHGPVPRRHTEAAAAVPQTPPTPADR